MLLKKVIVLTFICYSGLFNNVFSQTTSDTLRSDLDEVVINATYSPITIGKASMALSYYLRDAADIASRRAATMDELTFSLPGVSISNRENYALGERMTIRGLGWRSPFGVRGVQVLLDNLPLTVADGQTIMNMIDPAMVKRVELLRGPSSTIWGNSSGGVLYLSTIPNRDDPSLQYRGYLGSYNTLKQELRFNENIGDNRLYGYATYFDTEGFRDHSAATLFRTSIGSEHQLGDRSRLKLIANYASMPKAQHPGALDDETSFENPTQARQNFVDSQAGKTFDQAMVGASFLREFDSGILDISTHGTYRDLENPLPFGFIGLERLAGGVKATYSFQRLPFDLDVGSEVKIQRDDRFETDNINGERGDDVSVEQTEKVLNQAVFTRFSLPLTERLNVSAGLRADRISFEGEDGLGTDLEGSRDFFSLNPSAGITYQVQSNQLFANFSTSFQSPTTTELVNRPEGGNGFNQNVNPERTLGFETGIRGNSQNLRLQYDFTVYAMQVQDLLLPFQTEADGPVFFRNEGKTDHYGLEASVQVSPNDFFDVQLMVNILEATFNGGDLDGNNLPGVPKEKFSSRFTFRPGNQVVSLENQWTGSYTADSENLSLNQDYFLTNIQWTTNAIQLSDQSSLRPFISVNNVFNTRYNTSVNIDAFGGFLFEPGSDRSFQAGLQIDFN
ncbi:MAG: TonB-dependent receptor [Balneolaceae bacterium]